MLFSRPPVRLSWTSSFRSIRKIPLPCTRFFSTSVPRYTVDMAPVDTSERLSKLRQLMQDHKVDVYSMTSYVPVDCCCFLQIEGLFLPLPKSFLQKIAISRNTLRHVTLVEVRMSPCHHLTACLRLSSVITYTSSLQNLSRDLLDQRVRPLCL